MSRLAPSRAAAFVVATILGACGGRQSSAPTQATGSAAPTALPIASPTVLPGGGRTIFPAYRVIAYYGTADDPGLGVLGHGSPDEAGQRLLRQPRAFDRADRHMLPAFELIATIAQASLNDGTYNWHLDDAQIER